MSDRFLRQIRQNFDEKSTSELRRVVADRDSGEWSEDGIKVAEELRAERLESRFRLVRLICGVSLAGFAILLGWQLIVLATNGYPEHIIPVVIFFSGTKESVPVAYSWTLYLAVMTVVGTIASFVGCLVVKLWLKTNRS